jgi:SP family myo-inositol transporter-like MFS transporter 13
MVRYMLGLAAIPSAIQFVGFLLLPESPRWFVNKGRLDQARSALQKIRQTTDVEKELDAIRQSIEESSAANGAGQGMVYYGCLFR